ncbi:MAG: SUMF1/EgtB/PvdO family nonheme iron enzyme [Chloroflexi bacterium]|nr:SUMF1/EgtB/PvdO family nonheme iron enzyme [Chloroflexota bacterium]
MAEVWPCSADCAIAPRIGGTLDDEVCVPGGPFLMGTDIPQHIQTDNVPVHTVTLTPYLIDVYKVTNARYRACVAAGVCVAPLGPYASSGCTYGLTPTSDWDAFPITNLTWEQATQFCAWDGGRVLPSEAQWEKAAKGPAPRQVPYTWGTDPNTTCAYARAYYCFLGARLEAVDARPESASYYGLHMMNQGVWEWTADWYDAGYYSTSPSLDPTGPSTGTLHVFRGTGYQGASTLPFPSIAARHSLTGWLPEDVRGFRCARRAY